MVVEVGRGLVLGGGWVEVVWDLFGLRFWWVLVGVGILRVECGAGRIVVESVGGWWGVHALHWNMLSWFEVCAVVLRGILFGWVGRVVALGFTPSLG